MRLLTKLVLAVVATAAISVEMLRSAAIRRITASCWKSFSPNRATSGRTESSNLATTVATPSKWPGLASPSQRSETPETWIEVEKPSG
jgi:hypothetical protein